MSQPPTWQEEKQPTLSPTSPRTTTKTAPPLSSPNNSRRSSPAPAHHLRDDSTSPVDKRRHASIAGIGVGVTRSYSPTQQSSGTHGYIPAKTTTRTFPGAKTFPGDHHRSSSDTVSRDKGGGGIGTNSRSNSPSIPHIVLPRRTGKSKQKQGGSAVVCKPLPFSLFLSCKSSLGGRL